MQHEDESDNSLQRPMHVGAVDAAFAAVADAAVADAIQLPTEIHRGERHIVSQIQLHNFKDQKVQTAAANVSVHQTGKGERGKERDRD